MKVGEHRPAAREKARAVRTVEAMMATYERPGMLTETVGSFMRATPGVGLTVFDDGSSSREKAEELDVVAGMGAEVVRFPHRGFVVTWMAAFGRMEKVDADAVVLLEDDLSFAVGWMDVLKCMHNGAAEMGMLPGAMSCLRVHNEPQAKVVDLWGVEAYQSMAHGFQVNLFPADVVRDRDLLDEAVVSTAFSRHGLDVHLLGLLGHRRGRTNFVSMRSWVAHEGSGASVVKGQGYRSFEHRGYGLVGELRKGDEA